MSQTKIKNKTIHTPVLLDEVVRTLDPKAGERYLDLTAGYGGHAQVLLEHTRDQAVLIDRDSDAIAVLSEVFADNEDVVVEQSDFLQAVSRLDAENEHFLIVLADLGVSSLHLDKTARGFSFREDVPLDMRMDRSQAVSAESVVNEWDQAGLTRILREYGEEPRAAKMARLIEASRPIHTTAELAAVAKRVWTGHSRVHPATRLFQAVRIAVNDELGQLEKSLPHLVNITAPGGRIGIITFHSLEDRIVKRFFKQLAGDTYDAVFEEITSKPITATAEEIVFNPRSRSAKLRVYRKRK